MGTDYLVSWFFPFYAAVGLFIPPLMYVQSSDLGTTYHYSSPGNYADVAHVTVLPGEMLPLIKLPDTVNTTGVNITWDSSSTSSISISWSWVFATNYHRNYQQNEKEAQNPSMTSSRQKHLKRKFLGNHFVEGWNIGYHVQSGSFLSKTLPPDTSSYSLQGLQSNTPYNVCVNAKPLRGRAWPANQPHSFCRMLRTVPMIRTDSIVGLFLCFGYYLLMIGLGVMQWKRRHFLNRRWKRNSIEEHSEDKQEAAMRWRDLDDTDNETSRLKSADN